MSEKPRATLADYVVIALSPALIMGLIGSLVFFLLEVFYRGQYGSNLRWILFFYVFGAVLGARLTVSGEAEGRGFAYSIILSILTWIGALRFASYPDTPIAQYAGLINLFLILVIAWSASKLVRDCTHIDDSMDVEARGLLEASGLEEQEQGIVPPAGSERDGKSKKKTWLQRWWDFHEASKKKRTPGVWVVYFSLAALPLFGLGQAFIPPQAGERREYTFWLLVLYLGCGLGLLLTTCFLGLRRYLRQRKLSMPRSMTAAWLLLGGLLIGLLLTVTALIPRPEAGYSALASNAPTEEDRDANNQSVIKDSKGKDSQNPQGKGDKDAKEGNRRDRDSPDRDKDGGKRDKDGQKDRPAGGDKDRKDSGSVKDRDRKEPNPASEKKDPTESTSSSSPPSLEPLTNLLHQLGPWVKWLVFAILALVVIIWLIRNGLRYLANFTDWARKLLDWFSRLWASLFGGGTESETVAGDGHGEAEPLKPFRSYPDPFLTGACESMDERELVRYTFAALQAWGREQGLERRPDETPMEYATRLAGEQEEMADWIRKLTSLYARAVYGFGPLPEATEDFLREFWLALEAASTSAP